MLGVLHVALAMAGAAPPPPPGTLLLTEFGGKSGDGFNNQKAFKAAFAACDARSGCTLELPPSAPGVPTLYRTSAINLTSNLDLVIPPNVTLRATENDADNSGENWPTLQHSSAPGPCAGTPGNCGCAPAKQSWIHAYNQTNLTISGGGTIHGGGRYWWCVRSNLAHGHRKWQPAMETHGCATTKALPNVTVNGVTRTSTCPPRMLHIVQSENIKLSNINVRWAGYWTLHFQFSNNIEVKRIHLWNPSNSTFNGPNGDGIDIDSSTNAYVHDSIIDAADDALCIKSGADWLGRHVDRPTENVLFEDIEVRNGHGLTLGSDCSGGARNITWRHIHLNGRGPTCTNAAGVHTCGNGIGRGAGPSSAHWKTGRGRGGTWRDIMWDDIYGDSVANAIAFSGGNYIAAPKTNMTATPKIFNVTVQNMVLTRVEGAYQGISTLSESPIHGLHLKNITFKMEKDGRPAWTCAADCTGPARGQGCVNKIFATGTVEAVSPPLPKDCDFTTPAPVLSCTVTKLLGCYNDSKPVFKFGSRADHDDVTQPNCAAICDAAGYKVAGIDQGNHCQCGTSAALSGAKALPLSACSDKAWPCTGVCCGPHAPSGCNHGACTGKPSEHCGSQGALLAYTFACHKTSQTRVW